MHRAADVAHAVLLEGVVALVLRELLGSQLPLLLRGLATRTEACALLVGTVVIRLLHLANLSLRSVLGLVRFVLLLGPARFVDDFFLHVEVVNQASVIFRTLTTHVSVERNFVDVRTAKQCLVFSL